MWSEEQDSPFYLIKSFLHIKGDEVSLDRLTLIKYSSLTLLVQDHFLVLHCRSMAEIGQNFGLLRVFAESLPVLWINSSINTTAKTLWSTVHTTSFKTIKSTMSVWFSSGSILWIWVTCVSPKNSKLWFYSRYFRSLATETIGYAAIHNTYLWEQNWISLKRSYTLMLCSFPENTYLQKPLKWHALLSSLVWNFLFHLIWS